MNVIIDFDNTFYTPQRDVDDGMALLYLLGNPQVNVVGITGTFGNGSIEKVDRCTKRLMKDLNIESIPYAKGAKEAGDYLTEASQLLVDLVDQYAGDVHLLALGALSNLQGAYLRDALFFQKVKEIVLMGGITEPLIFNKQEMLELNFSCDPQASFTVLTKGSHVSIMTGNNCLGLLSTRKDYEAYLGKIETPLAKLIKDYTDPWFQDNEDEYGIKGFYNWDSLAAAYLINPSLFQDQWQEFTVSVHGLSTGSLVSSFYDTSSYINSKPIEKVRLNTPKIKNQSKLNHQLFSNWLNAVN